MPKIDRIAASALGISAIRDLRGPPDTDSPRVGPLTPRSAQRLNKKISRIRGCTRQACRRPHMREGKTYFERSIWKGCFKSRCMPSSSKQRRKPCKRWTTGSLDPWQSCAWWRVAEDHGEARFGRGAVRRRDYREKADGRPAGIGRFWRPTHGQVHLAGYQFPFVGDPESFRIMPSRCGVPIGRRQSSAMCSSSRSPTTQMPKE